ncbi:MAG: RIP metalloprotease RseP [Planctomycetaceae bacterium]
MDTLAVTLPPQLAMLVNILYVALGLGLVIFIHELGHFAVAKWCGVKVERFSIGFGPILWRHRRGETEYALSAVPFGGYVKMLGQDDADPSKMADERIARDPRSYTSKSVPQRIAIISAGVINNMLSAVLFFILAFMLGVKYQPALVGQVTPGKPGWKANLRLGDEITRVNDREDPHLAFVDLQRAVALSAKDEELRIEGLRDGKTFRTVVKPELLENSLFPQIFVEPEPSLTLHDRSKGGPSFGPTVAGLSASAAKPPLKDGDEIKEIDGQPIPDYATLQRTLSKKRDKTVEMGMRRKGDKESAPLKRSTIGPNHFRTLGLRMAIGRVAAVQKGSPAERGEQAEQRLIPGDTITHVFEMGEAKRIDVDLDPMRLPDYFAERAGQPVRVRVKREVKGGNPTTFDVELVPEDRPGWVERPDLKDCPLSVPSIGAAFHVLHHVVAVEVNSPAANAGLLKDDNLIKMSLVLPEGSEGDSEDRKPIVINFAENERNWPRAFWQMQAHPLRTVQLTVKSQGEAKEKEFELTPAEVADWYLPMRGFIQQELMQTRKADGIAEAVALGFRHTRDAVVDMWMTIRGLTSGRISPKALGGPIRIGGTAYYVSKRGLPDLILFLGMLSVNLAVLNFLPIPVLDGGHFVFLCWEGIRGKPPSERVVITATYLGLALVLSLMAWVMYMDISGLIVGRN